MSIDDLLRQPLAAMPDNGFSARVMSRIKAEQRQRVALVAFGSAAAAALGCLVVPMPALSAQLSNIIIQIGTSPAVAAAVAALVLTALVDRRLFRI